ncbi:TetR/AcrR family transcriptional regulator [Nocardiopsis sp. EMB25]|uniref:TetR/AcrR family transcriptional regulator n=1 Tax=Nocardiopsis TaxID=2013 RepID=UPI00034B21EF|nr:MULTISPECIES: TetR/AcrR family transcriptional regulator [Nocardiopsis]MCY9786107.1 TetR/AcrR family transcriptional regulator [Nocardiopsis sp. EMB25]
MPDRPYHHGDLRAVLLANAERALAERGPAALSLRELAREAGVSHAAPSRHFRDKQALIDALALTGFERLTERMEGTAKVEDGDDTLANLIRLARTYVDFAVEHPALLDLMYTRKHDPDVSEQLAAAVERMLDSVVSPIREGQAAGEIAEGDPLTIAMTVSATLHGFVMFKADADPADVEVYLADVMGVLYNGIAPR